MGISIVTLALARKAGKKQADKACADAIAAAKAYTDDRINHIISFEIRIVDTLPPLVEADPHIIYFVKRISPSGEADYYYEYMVIDGEWEIIGSTELDLSDYWTIEEVKAYVHSKEYTLPPATTETLGGVKPDGISIDVRNDGTIFVRDDYVNDMVDGNFEDITESQISDLFND